MTAGAPSSPSQVPAELLDQFRTLWDELAPIGRAESGGYRRFAWTAEDAQLREWFRSQAQARDLHYEEDRAGNQWAWWNGPGNGAVVTGSHLDSVPDGGAYDGPLGVVSALLAVDQLRARGVQPARPVAVVNMSDEEGARFGVACLGSRLITGAITADKALGLTDDAGTTLADALREAGQDPTTRGVEPDLAKRVGAFVELHVEQGRAMVDMDDVAITVASKIWPHGRWRIDLPGEANHAGTTRLVDRNDAMLLAAEVTQEVRRAAEANGAVATVGKIDVIPGGINAIASHVTCWLDVRAEDDDAVHATVDQITAAAQERGGSVDQLSWTDATPFTPALTEHVAQVLGVPLLSTGAGHDAGILASAGIPSAMLFVRNPTGHSHTPAESATDEDCVRGVLALTDVLADLACAEQLP